MEPIGHCPFVGLKQNRAIRFASPTPEHRCYIEGQPIEIPVEQEIFCLAPNHVQCPLYTGLRTATTEQVVIEEAVASKPPATPMPGWFTSLSSRDRLVYGIMLGLLATIVAIYLISGFQSLVAMPDISSRTATARSTSQIVAIQPSTTSEIATSLPSTVLPSPTALPSSVPTLRPTERPTRGAVFFPPTSTPVPPTTAIPSSTATVSIVSGTVAPGQTATTNPAQPTHGQQGVATTSVAAANTVQLPATPVPATQPPAANTPRPAATRVPATRVPATRVPATRVPATRVPAPPVQPTARPAEPTAVPTRAPTIAPTSVPATAVPPPPPTAVPATAVPPPPPTAAPPVADVRNEVLWLYFGDTTGTLYVPVQRQVRVENKQVAHAAVQALIAGPRNGLTQVLDPAAQLLDVQIDNGTAVVNFDRNPVLDGRGKDALSLTLTHFSSIQRVQIQVQGQNLDGPRARPVLNPINPLGLPVDYSQTAFLPLYFLSVDGSHQVRMIRMVPKTYQTAEGTVRALLEGPGKYDYALRRVIPAASELRSISIENGVVIVDLTRPFADAGERKTAVRTLAASLTTLPTVQGVRILVEGQALSDYWGEGYGGVFTRPVINGE